ncbi:MAG: DUF4112 domain-containing protein [Verrucomicrobiales bacterium]|nr:DUF4112 domain-containing protein [Verrucomicrobiales bacterium]
MSSPEPNPGSEDPAELDLPVTLDELRRSKKVSWILDECIRIPGTQIRFGLDPILGLFPYGGETIATVIGASILGEAGKKGIPFRTLMKMGGNMILNAGVGTIPVMGDLFSVWFKSNSRNYRLLNRFLESDEGEQEPGGWWPVFVILGILGTVLLLNILSWVFFSALLYWSIKQLGLVE